MIMIPNPDDEAPGGVAHRMRALCGAKCNNGATIIRAKPAASGGEQPEVIVLAVAHPGTDHAEYVTWVGIESDALLDHYDEAVHGTIHGHYHGRDLAAAMTDFEARS